MEKSISQREKNRGRLCIICTALLWGLAGVCVKSICWSSLSIMAARSFTSMISLGIMRKSFRVRLTKKNVICALLAASTSLLYMMGIKNTTAGTAIVLQYTAPIIILLLNILFYHKKPDVREILIVAAVFAGCVLSFADDMGAGHLLGNILSLASGVTYALQIMMFSRDGVDADDSMMLSNMIGFVVGAPFLFFDKRMAQTTPTTVIWLVIMCLFQYSLANILYVRGCKTVSDIECSLLMTLEPIFNPIPVAIFCGETMGRKAIIGFVIVIAGIVVYTLTSKKQTAG